MNDLLSIALSAALARAKGRRSATWLAQCAGWRGRKPKPTAAPSDADLDVLLDAAWRSRPKADRRRMGAVFTPRHVARQLLLEIFEGGEVKGTLDPACGGGIFLVEAARLAAQQQMTAGVGQVAAARYVLENIHGVDIDPDTARLARLLLGIEVIEILGEAAEDHIEELPLPDVRCADATEIETLEAYRGQIHAVVGNPPYREAKGMESAARDALRRRFGALLSGAFDMYLCFLLLGLEIVGEEGYVGYVLPNKLLVARYAEIVRARLSQAGRLQALIDLSEVDVFGRVGVYPVIAVFGPRRPSFKSCFALTDTSRLGREQAPGIRVPTELLSRTGVWFLPPDPELGALIERLSSNSPLSSLARVRSTCSFHEKGLRERYIQPGSDLPEGLPYLGGRSFNRRNEISPYRVDWQGFRIRYDEEELRAVGNPLPPLSCFQRPKLVLCQHARSAIAWFDEGGQFVTKDVYPIAYGDDPDLVAALAAVINSRTFSVLYAILHRGIAIGGGYLHFLPVFLHRVPVPSMGAREIRTLSEGVRALQAEPSHAAAEGLDETVASLYALTDTEIAAVHRYAARIGFGEDLLDRR